MQRIESMERKALVGKQYSFFWMAKIETARYEAKLESGLDVGFCELHPRVSSFALHPSFGEAATPCGPMPLDVSSLRGHLDDGPKGKSKGKSKAAKKDDPPEDIEGEGGEEEEEGQGSGGRKRKRNATAPPPGLIYICMYVCMCVCIYLWNYHLHYNHYYYDYYYYYFQYHYHYHSHYHYHYFTTTTITTTTSTTSTTSTISTSSTTSITATNTTTTTTTTTTSTFTTTDSTTAISFTTNFNLLPSTTSTTCFSISTPSSTAWPGDKRCRALTYQGHQCLLQRKPKSKFCGNHSTATAQRWGLALSDQEEAPEGGAEVFEEAVVKEEEVQLVEKEELLAFGEGCLDIDMFYVPTKVEDLGEMSKWWESSSGPTLKIFTGRPLHLQLFQHPLAVFLPIPETCNLQDFKHKVCKALYDEGVEVPIPTSPPLQNLFNGCNVARRHIKATHHQVAHALRSVEVEEVWVGQFGGKVPLDQWEQEFGHVLSLPMSPSIAFDMGWYLKDKSSIYLFGISGGRGEVQIGRCALKGYIHPILPGFSQPDENIVRGTLELRFTGPAGSEKDKFLQAYSPMSHVIKACGEYKLVQPQTMKSLRSRKQGVINLVDTMLSNLDKVGGARLQQRSPHVGPSLGEDLDVAQNLLKEVCQYLSEPAAISIKRIPVPAYRDFLKKEMKAAVDKATFKGMRDSGPETEEQQKAFGQKVKQWACLMSNIGLFSGQFGRLITNGSSCQNAPGLSFSTPKKPTRPSKPTEATPTKAKAVTRPWPWTRPVLWTPLPLQWQAQPRHKKKAKLQVWWPLCQRGSHGPQRCRASLIRSIFQAGARRVSLWSSNIRRGGLGKKGNWSCWYPSKGVACRALAAWGGDDWARKVVLQAQQPDQPPEQPPTPFLAPKEVCMKESPSTQRSLSVLSKPSPSTPKQSQWKNPFTN